jgi:hypothetical protein
MPSASSLDRRPRAAGRALLLSVLVCAVAPAAAPASEFGYEGPQIVARADPGEPMASFRITVDAAAGTVTAIDETEIGTAPFRTQRGAPRAGAGCRNDVVERSTIRRRAAVCPLAGAQDLRIEWAGATPDPTATTAPGPNGSFAMAVSVTGGSLPLIYQGSPGPESLTATTTASAVADMGDGDDGLMVTAASGRLGGGAGNDILIASGSGLEVDAGPGDDGVEAVLGDGAGVLGGAGDDRINVSTWHSDKATQALAPLRRQRVDCGDGSDTLIADARDEAGPGCAPAPAGLKEGMTLGRFDRAGRLRATLGRATVPSSVRYRIVGSEPPRLKPDASPRHEIPWGKPGTQSVKRVSGAIRANVKLLASVRRALRRTDRRSVPNVSVRVDLRRAGAAGDVTTVALGGVVRRAGR